MATYSQELDKALLPVPWLAKRDNNDKSFLIKYAPHPSKPGYVVLVTDLIKVYFEPLAGIRLLARQREVEDKYGQSQKQQDAGGSSLDIGGEEAVQEVLDGVASLMGDELEGAQLEVSTGDLYDVDVSIRSDDTSWLIHMTEIRYGSLEIITRHVIHPLALSISSSRRPANTTDDQITELVTSSKVLESVNRHSSHKQTDSRKKASPAPSPRKDKPTEPEASGSSKSRLVRRRPDTSKTASPSPAPPSQGGKSKSPGPTLHNDMSSSRRKGKGKKPDEDEPTKEDDDEEMMPEEPSSPPAKSSTPETKHTPRRGSKPSSPPRSTQKKKQDTPPGESDQEIADQTHTPTPPPPSAPSQKTQQEKDDEEEQALAKKREEMKRRMGAGGGGRLVRRRFG